MEKRKNLGSRKNSVAVLLIIILTGMTYANSLKNEFVWDDSIVITGNDFIKSWAHAPLVFSKKYLSPYTERGGYFFPAPAGTSGETSYRPVVTLTYFFDYTVWKLNPAGFHLTNLMLHVLNALLLFIFILYTTQNTKVAVAAVILFALHPVNSEAVNVASFREELLVLFFLLITLIIHRSVPALSGFKKAGLYSLSLVTSLLALFSKEMALAMPALIVLHDYNFVSHRGFRQLLIRHKFQYAGYAAITLFYVVVRFAVMANHSEPPATFPGGTIASNVATMARVIATYIRWLVFPVGIHATLPENSPLISRSLLEPPVLLALACILACLALAVKARKNAKTISFSILWFFIALLPVTNIIPLSQYMAARYLYVPSVGFCFLAACALHRLAAAKVSARSKRSYEAASRVALIILLAGYSVITTKRNYVWRNETMLWSELAREYPGNGFAYFGLANSYDRAGFKPEAVQAYTTAIELNPRIIDAYNSLGALYGESRNYPQAIAHLRKAIDIDPDFLDSYNNLAVTYTHMANWAMARKTWEKALTINPAFQAAHDGLQKLKKLGHS